MPFTPTHILAVLPIHFSYRKLLLPALAVGSMIPDFVMFFPISDYHFSHSLVGLFAYCLPMGLVVYYLWEWFGKEFAIALSPERIQCRIDDYRRSKPRFDLIDILLIAIAIVIGSISHVVWDAFTHQGEWGVELIPLLANKLEIASITIPGYKLFQYGSTFIGLPLLFCLGFLYLKNIKDNSIISISSLKPSFLYAIACSFGIIPIAIAFYYWYRSEPFKTIVGNTIKQSIGAGIALFFIYGIIYKLSFHKLLKTQRVACKTFYKEKPMIFSFEGYRYRANMTASEIYGGYWLYSSLPIKLPDGRFIMVDAWATSLPPQPDGCIEILNFEGINQYKVYATAELLEVNLN